jgi:hypothetical protein
MSLSVTDQATRDREALRREEAAVLGIRNLPDFAEESRRERGVLKEWNGLVTGWER